MNPLARLVCAAALVALGACGAPEERPFNEQFNTAVEGLENKAAALDAEAANAVDAQAAELEEQARALRQAPADPAGNFAAGDGGNGQREAE